jgi:hypothetical protein
MRKPAVIGRVVQAAVDRLNQSSLTNVRLQVMPREDVPLYAEDALWTYRGHAFVDEPRFQQAYARAVRAAGFDYRIRWRVHTILWAAERGIGLDGAFVECGTGRGFMASAICEYLAWKDRPFYLYDTFLPSFPDAEGAQPEGGSPKPNYATDMKSVERNFSEWPGVRLIAGRVPDTLLDTRPVAFLHVDMNHAAPEEAAVRHFWPRLAPGAPVIFDDSGFGGFEAQRDCADRLGE